MSVYCKKPDGCPGHEYMMGTCPDPKRSDGLIGYDVCCGLETGVCDQHARPAFVPEFLRDMRPGVAEQLTSNPVEATLVERNRTYGDFDKQARITQELKTRIRVAPNWIYDHLAEDQKEALEMIMSKIARILNGDPNHVDSWHDIAGYARLIEKRLTETQGDIVK